MASRALLALLALTAAPVLVSATPIIDARAACATGVHVIVARGSTESPGEGSIGAVADQIKAKIPGSDSVAVPYPATLDNYVSSESYGTGNMTKLVNDYVKQCPNSKMVLMGYSQGGQITLDTLCGTTEGGWNQTSALAAKYSKNIIAAIAMGDPSHVVGMPYNVGTSKHNGIFPRSGNCAPYASLIQSYCDSNDTFCDSGQSIQVHLGYIKEYNTAATNFVVKKYNAAK